MIRPRTALVTGASGQDGWHLIEFLRAKGYRIVATTRRSSAASRTALVQGVDEYIEWSGLDQKAIDTVLELIQPDECYNLAACASGAGMYDDPVAMGEVNGLAVTRLLEAIRVRSPETRFVQASSSEVFGRPMVSPQNESTPRNPRSPYGAAKLYADTMVGLHRERFGLFACSAILYNHESPRRSLDFVSRKVTQGAAAIKLNLTQHLTLGNLEARRDWGYAGDYVMAMWRMLQADAPEDYVIATGVSHSVRDMCERAFGHVGLDYRQYVREDAIAFRSAEVVPLVGDAGKASRGLDWRPSVDFGTMIEMMVDHDVAQLQRCDSSQLTGAR